MRHRGYTILIQEFSVQWLVHIYFQQAPIFITLDNLLESWSQTLAWPAPVSIEVQTEVSVSLLGDGLEIRGPLNLVYFLGGE